MPFDSFTTISRSLSAFVFLLFIGAVASSCKPHEATVADSKPKLILYLTVDQLRGDLLDRLAPRFTKNGFRRLMDNGIVYSNAHFRHGITHTAVGHAALFTGASANDHGMAGNEWMQRESGERTYCVEDKTSTLVGQPDREGRSPKNLSASTFGDELVLANNGESKVIAVSVKDRGAVLPAGHTGKAFWFDKVSGGFVSSTHYYSRYPTWLELFNERKLPESYSVNGWQLGATQTYLAKDDRHFERPPTSMSVTFPHSLDHVEGENLYSLLRFTPMADELTAEFAIAAIQAESLGQRGVPDVLALSFSSTDYIGHAWGPNSREAEDNLLRLDKTIARLLNVVDETVGLQNTLVVVSADHGVNAATEHSEYLGVPASHHDLSAVTAELNAAFKAKFDVKFDAVRGFATPSFYLNEQVLRAEGISLSEAESFVADEIKRKPGFARAYRRTDLLSGNIPNDLISKRMARGFHGERSGHVLVVVNPFWYLSTSSHYAGMHGSPWNYDTHVPLIAYGMNLTGKRIARRVAPEDMVPTLSALLKTNPPTAADGEILNEVLGAE